MQQLRQGVTQYPATGNLIDQHGVRFTVDIPVTGPNGNTATVLTGWIYRPGSATPSLITLRVK
jgi:filamentous hemagglutinin